MPNMKRNTISKEHVEQIRQALIAAPDKKKEEKKDFNAGELVNALKKEINHLIKRGFKLKEIAAMILGAAPLPFATSTIESYIKTPKEKRNKERVIRPTSIKTEKSVVETTKKSVLQKSTESDKGSGKFQIQPDTEEI